MAIELRPEERVILSVDYHWSTYLGSVFHLVVFSVLATVPWLAVQYMERFAFLGPALPTVREFAPYFIGLFLVVGVQPLLVRWLQNHCKHYVLTNERMYVEEGILSKTKHSVPIGKINDVILKQSILQRIVGTGTVIIMTGNDDSLRIKGITYPDRLRRQLCRLLTVSLRQAS